jgi:hypothetical protein
MWLAGAPSHYPLVNCAALALACLWIIGGRGPHTAPSRHLLAAVLVLVMASPLLVGPELTSTTGNRVVRWFPLGAVALHTGMLATPALGVLAARNRRLAAPILLAAVIAALFQPDAATGFAITFAAVGLHHVTKDWRVGLVAVAGFFAALLMSVSGELPPQLFVEGVLMDAGSRSLVLGASLALALGAGFALILFAIPFDRATRFTLAGLLFGYGVVALMAPYPAPLIGYGAAPILGFGLALGLHRIPAR